MAYVVGMFYLFTCEDTLKICYLVLINRQVRFLVLKTNLIIRLFSFCIVFQNSRFITITTVLLLILLIPTFILYISISHTHFSGSSRPIFVFDIILHWSVPQVSPAWLKYKCLKKYKRGYWKLDMCIR